MGVVNDNGSLVWVIDQLKNNQTAILYYKVLASETGRVINEVIVSSDSYDFNSSNNIASAIVDVIEEAIKVNSTTPEHTDSIRNNNVSNAKYIELEKTGMPIVILILALFSLIPFSLRYFNRK